MTAAQKCSFFPQDPYYIPGYGGFYPQVRYQLGKTYGRTTCEMLTDPGVHKSPCSVLAPLTRPKFIEDYSRRNLPEHEMVMDQYQKYVPGYTGEPFSAPAGAAHSLQSSSRARPAAVCSHSWATAGGDARGAEDAVPPGRGWARGPPILLHGERRDKRKRVPSAQTPGPFPFQPTQIEAMPLPPATETVDVKRFGRIPRLDMPNLIQRKAISGYTGFIPRFTWIMGVNYLKGVKEAMNEFDHNQVTRTVAPGCSWTSLGRLPRTYWPNTQIYTSSGLMPFYTGFVPSKSRRAPPEPARARCSPLQAAPALHPALQGATQAPCQRVPPVDT
uniref:Family with sequence similarity 166 member A n=1 Tax=Varanus komodoensis TaxID=61221 RepID=A0A8D2IY58_VARKO